MAREGSAPAEILWDRWGVPHIYAADPEGLFHAFGWAQMSAHGDLLLLSYGLARARGAEYWGEAHRPLDEFLRTMDAPRRSRDWYALQSPRFRRYLDAFAAGINSYARAHPDRIADSVEVVLPVRGVDVLAHAQLGLQFTYLAGPGVVRGAREHLGRGSNAWAIAPSRTTSGHSMLLANPHLPWDPPFFEAHLVAPGVDLYGVSLVGGPVPVIAFNPDLGWTHTVNTVDPVDRFELSLVPGGYRFDGAVLAFEERLDTLLVREPGGALRAVVLRVRESVHGPVLAATGDRAVAIRIAGLDTPGLLEQWWEMGRARTLEAFQAALRRHQLPLFTVIYADREGHILHQFAGHVPARSEGDFLHWRFTPMHGGDTSAVVWTEVLPFEQLPRVLDPPTGWLQNANEAPWTTTFPRVLEPDSFPPHVAPRAGFLFRSQRSARMLASDSKISLDELIAYKHSTRMELADRVLDDLIPAARLHGGPIARRAADVLEAWDRSADAESRGAVLFADWVRELGPALPGRGFWSGDLPLFSTPFDLDRPLSTPDGLADPAAAVAALEAAAVAVEREHGSLDVPWGEVHRLRANGLDLPANGGGDPLGIFRATFYRDAGDGTRVAVGGDSYVAAVEFSDPVRARALLVYGNASQPDSPHRWDQLELYAAQRLREVWLDRAAVEANLERHETVPAAHEIGAGRRSYR